MKRTLSTAGLASVCLLALAPAANAHGDKHYDTRRHHDGVERRIDHSRDYYARADRHAGKLQQHRDARMPRWLKRDRRFRQWFRSTPLSAYRFLSWNELYDIYRWERRYFRNRRN